MKRTNRYLSVLASGLFAVSLFASQGRAHEIVCSADTTSWENATIPAPPAHTYTCAFFGLLNPTQADASSWSATNNGTKFLMADLKATRSIPSDHTVRARAIGLTGGGQEIAACDTRFDTSVAEGTTVLDANGGCENAEKHRLYVSLGHGVPN